MAKNDYKSLRTNVPLEQKSPHTPMPKAKSVIGLDELVTIKDNNHKTVDVVARIDTGAEWSSIDKKLFEQLSFGPVSGQRVIKSASGSSKRHTVEVTVIIKGKSCTSLFTIADRSRLKYKLLIGQNILTMGFIIDPSIERIIK